VLTKAIEVAIHTEKLKEDNCHNKDLEKILESVNKIKDGLADQDNPLYIPRCVMEVSNHHDHMKEEEVENDQQGVLVAIDPKISAELAKSVSGLQIASDRYQDVMELINEDLRELIRNSEKALRYQRQSDNQIISNQSPELIEGFNEIIKKKIPHGIEAMQGVDDSSEHYQYTEYSESDPEHQKDVAKYFNQSRIKESTGNSADPSHQEDILVPKAEESDTYEFMDPPIPIKSTTFKRKSRLEKLEEQVKDADKQEIKPGSQHRECLVNDADFDELMINTMDDDDFKKGEARDEEGVNVRKKNKASKDLALRKKKTQKGEYLNEEEVQVEVKPLSRDRASSKTASEWFDGTEVKSSQFDVNQGKPKDRNDIIINQRRVLDSIVEEKNEIKEKEETAYYKKIPERKTTYSPKVSTILESNEVAYYQNIKQPYRFVPEVIDKRLEEGYLKNSNIDKKKTYSEIDPEDISVREGEVIIAEIQQGSSGKNKVRFSIIEKDGKKSVIHPLHVIDPLTEKGEEFYKIRKSLIPNYKRKSTIKEKQCFYDAEKELSSEDVEEDEYIEESSDEMYGDMDETEVNIRVGNEEMNQLKLERNNKHKESKEESEVKQEENDRKLSMQKMKEGSKK
jgi:hypothetical protein